jgi:hypothetical protein
MLPKIRSLKKRKRCMEAHAKGLSKDQLFMPRQPATSTFQTPARRKSRRTNDCEDYGISSLSLRSRLREAKTMDGRLRLREVRSQFSKATSSYFRPIAAATTATTATTTVVPALFCGSGSLQFSSQECLSPECLSPRPRGISLTGIESTPSSEIKAANQGHVLAQLRIMRAKLKSREGITTDTSATDLGMPELELSESPCPGEY